MDNKNKQKKIIFVLPTLDAGGAERVLITLMNNIDRTQYAPELLSIHPQGPLKDMIGPGIPTHTLNKKPSSLILSFVFALYRQLRSLEPDIVVSTMTHVNLAVLMCKPFLPMTTFIIREAITPSFFFDKYKKLKWLIKKLYEVFYSKADVILSPSQRIFDEFSDELNLDKRSFTLLKNPVNTVKINHALYFQNVVNEKQQVVRFVACGRLYHQKGFDRLIEALGREELPYQWRLDILGEGPERSHLEALIKVKGLEAHVFLRGLVMPPYPYMAQADCFIMPSRFEGLPNVVLESLACGTPVIATEESGGISEIAHDCGDHSVRIVKDMDEFLKEMSKVSSHSKTKAAPSLLAECYEQAVVVKNFEQILRSLS